MIGPEGEQSLFENGSVEVIPIQTLVLKLVGLMDESRCYWCDEGSSHRYHLRVNEDKSAWMEWNDDLPDVNISLKHPTHIETWNWNVDREAQTAELEKVIFGTHLDPPVLGFLAVGEIDYVGRTLSKSKRHLKEISSNTRKLFTNPEIQRVALSLLLGRLLAGPKEEESSNR